jgi:predicted nuclease of predicted toxin-antitoxin system
VGQSRVLLSADTDYGEILARSGSPTPSVVLFRRIDRSAESITSVLLANLDQVAEDLDRGAFVVIVETKMRVRSLPLH